MLTQSWPSFNKRVGGHSYWLLFGLNIAAGVSPRAVLYNFFQSLTKDRCAIQISVYFILPETKGISLERMDTIFGGPDNVAAGESEGTSEKREAMAIMNEGEETPVAHVEDAAQDRSSRGPERSSV